MPTGIIRVEDLPKVAQLATGAVFYVSQSGTPFNTNTLDILNAINATNTFITPLTLTSSGQSLYGLLTGFSGELKTYSNWTNQIGYDLTGLNSIDWNNRRMIDGSGNNCVSWANRTLFNSWTFTGPIISNQDGGSSIETNPRFLWDKSGVKSVLWNDRNLSGNWKLNGTGIATSVQLAVTGTNLQTQINNIVLGTGIRSLNGISSGNVTIAGQGGVTINTNGQTISVSGSNTIQPTVNFSTNIDWSAGNVFSTNITGGSTFTFSNNNDGQSIVVSIKSTATGVLNWPAQVKWPNSIVPSPSVGKTDVYTFINVGTGIFANAVQGFSN